MVKHLWEMILNYSKNTVTLTKVPVEKESDKLIIIGPPATMKRLNKDLIDTHPRLLRSGGQYFTSPKLAIDLWLETYNEKVRVAQEVIKSLKTLKK